MSSLIPSPGSAVERTTVAVSLSVGTPSLEQLFVFARDAEQRWDSLRMRIEERRMSARGESLVVHEVLVRHPGLARVTSLRDTEPLSVDYDVWIGDGERVRTYAARDRRASDRAARSTVVGATRKDLPPFARLREVRTALPDDSMADTFVHPHGLFRNVLVTGPVAILGTAPVSGREAWIVRADHPRSSLVLTDRPDRWLEVGVDRATGLLLLLVERVHESVVRHAEVTMLELDAEIPDAAFRLHLGSDVRRIY